MKTGVMILPVALPAHRRQGGFTLLELLISMGMLGIIIAIIVSAAQLGYRAMDSGEKKIDSLERMRTSLRLINAQVQSQVPITYDDDEGRHVYFSGSSESLRFPTTFSLWGSSRGYVFVTYTVETDNAGKRFIRVQETPQAVERRSEARLFDSLDACSFSYFFRDATEETGTWKEDWTDPMTIPEKVRITLSQNRKDYSMIIPVRANTPLEPSASGPQSLQKQTGGFMGPF